MIRLRDTELLSFDPKIEKMCQRNRRIQKQSTSQSDIMTDPREERADTKALHDYAIPIVMETISGIRRLPIPANNFEIKPAIIQMVQAN